MVMRALTFTDVSFEKSVLRTEHGQCYDEERQMQRVLAEILSHTECVDLSAL